MEIPHKPWLSLVSSDFVPKIISESTRQSLLKTKFMIGLKVYSEEKMYSQLIKRFIEILIFTKNKDNRDLFIKNLKEITNFPSFDSIRDQCNEVNNSFPSDYNDTKNIEKVLNCIYNPNYALYFETLSRQLILYELKKNTYNFYEDLQNWVQNTQCDIEGELISVLANALGCKIKEFIYLFNLKEISYGNNENSDLIISYFRVGDKNCLLMTIAQMENSAFDLTRNKYNIS